MNGAKKWEHLHPRTSTRPILLDEYLEQEQRSRLIDDGRLSPEWKKWFDERQGK